MPDLEILLNESASRHHNYLCPRQVLGARMGLYAAELLDVELPRMDKRLFVFVETDGCMTDGVVAATGCWWGRRTMYLIDYGKTAATFVDTQSDHAVRIWPTAESRARACEYVPDAPDRWHAQLIAYQTMPTNELLQSLPVTLNVSLQAIMSQHGRRQLCEQCGEDIMNEREVRRGGQVLCRACAAEAYYIATAKPGPFGSPRGSGRE